jgi:hypothetical protein
MMSVIHASSTTIFGSMLLTSYFDLNCSLPNFPAREILSNPPSSISLRLANSSSTSQLELMKAPLSQPVLPLAPCVASQTARPPTSSGVSLAKRAKLGISMSVGTTPGCRPTAKTFGFSAAINEVRCHTASLDMECADNPGLTWYPSPLVRFRIVAGAPEGKSWRK